MTTPSSHKISKDMYLVRQPISKAAPAVAKAVEVPTDHIYVIDCSGSMTYDLPKVANQVKRKLPKSLKESDTLTVIWFSGRGQCGVLLEAEPVATLKDLKKVEDAVDRWIRPIGMTGFKEPLVLAKEVAERLTKGNKGRATSLYFMSDGCDNQWSRGEILKVIEDVGTKVQSVTIVEYGYYADRPLLTSMAEKAGGTFIFAETFDRYEPLIEAAIHKKVTTAKRIEVEVKGDQIGGFAYALSGGDLVTFGIEGGKIAVPEDLSEVYYLSPSVIGKGDGDVDYKDSAQAAALYAAVSLFAVRMKPDVVYPLLKVLGDVQYIEQFSVCFGKQKYSEFMDVAKQAAFEPKLRLVKGYDPKRVPREDAFTVLDVLNLLQQDDLATVLLDAPEFKYSKIGRGRVDASDQLDSDEQAEIERLTAEMKGVKDSKKIKELTDKIAELANKPEALKPVRVKQPGGYPILDLTFNEDRPNVSMRVKHQVTIDLTKRLKTAPKGTEKVPANFECFQFRNYAVIKDGLINIETLPARISTGTFEKLLAEGVIDKNGVKSMVHGTWDVLLDLRKLPVINRQMVKTLSAKDFFQRSYDLTKAQAAQKVFKDYAKSLLPAKESKGYVDQYGADAATWLKEQGITDYNGYQPPKTTQAPTTDVYVGKELKVSLKGLSSLPKVADVQAKIMKKAADGTVEWLKNPKLNAPGALMADAVKEVETFLASPAYTKAKDQGETLKNWLEVQKKASIEKARQLIFEVAQATFVTVVGQVWFQEFASIDENTMNIKVDGNEIECKVEMKEVEIRI
jgi:hypothetical protein